MVVVQLCMGEYECEIDYGREKAGTQVDYIQSAVGPCHPTKGIVASLRRMKEPVLVPTVPNPPPTKTMKPTSSVNLHLIRQMVFFGKAGALHIVLLTSRQVCPFPIEHLRRT
jgi:hypothetical protein